jgi:hypothetical protein
VNIPSRFKSKPEPRTALGRFLQPRPWWVAPLGAVVGTAAGLVGVLTFKALRDLNRRRQDDLEASAPSGNDPANIGDHPSDDAAPPVA